MKLLAALLVFAALLVLVLRPWEGHAPTETGRGNAGSVEDGPGPEFAPLEVEPLTGESERTPAAPDPAVNSTGPESETETALLRATVLDEDGKGVFNARVSLELTEEELQRVETEEIRRISGRADRNGLVELEVPVGEERTLRAEERSYTSTELVALRAFVTGEVRELTITVRTRPDAELVGRVLDSRDGGPIAGVAVHVTLFRGMSFEPEPLPTDGDPAAITDDDGRFRVPLRTWVPNVGTFIAPGWSPQRAKLGVDPDSSVAEIEVTLRRACRITGQLTFEDTDGLWVRAVTRGRHLIQRHGHMMLDGGDVIFDADVEADGSFALDDLPSRVPLELRVESAGKTLLQEPQPLTLEPGETHEVNWALAEGGMLHGRVVDWNGVPVADQEVWLLQASEAPPGFLSSFYEPASRKRSDAQGQFTFSQLRLGTWTVGLAPDDQGRAGDDAAAAHAPLAVGVTITPEHREAEVELTLHQGLYIEGLLLDPEGQPVEGWVRAQEIKSSALLFEEAGLGGRFRLGPLVPGSYQLVGSGSWTPLLADSKEVEAHAGETGIELRLRPGGALSGSAVDGVTGQPAPATFGLAWGTEGWTAMYSNPPSAEFQFSGLVAGTYHLTATTDDGRVGRVNDLEVSAGSAIEAVVVIVQQGGFLKARYVGPTDTAHYAVLQDGVRCGYGELRRGGEARLAVPAGEVTVRLCDRNRLTDTTLKPYLFEREETVQIAVGIETEVLFEIPN